VKKKATKSR